eukprot:216088_1
MNNFEYFLSVGLGSNINEEDFKRKHLNLVIVLDRSGSMNYFFKREYVRKMEVANKAVISLLKQLTDKDRFGMIVFDNSADFIQKIACWKDINIPKLKEKILLIKAGGGTNFTAGYTAAIELYKEFMNNNKDANDEYDNRIIFLTDAKPNGGITDPKSLLGMVSKYANNELKKMIYTSFIGVGLDFNSELIEQISQTKGCNYYSVKSEKEFQRRMSEEFEYMVTPLVFNVCLKLKCEGNVCEIEKVYGTKDKKTQQIMETGEITKIGTLFPTLKSKKKGGTKGGIQMIRLKKNNQLLGDSMNVELEVTYEDRNGNKFKNCQLVTFDPPQLTLINDMIDIYDSDDLENDSYENENFYDNLGIRKGILLCKYVSLMRNWIQSTNKFKYQSIIFPKFLKYFNYEMKKCKDNQLEKEVTIIKKIINGN